MSEEEIQAVDALWRSLGMLDTPPRATSARDRDGSGLFGRLHSGHTPQAGSWQQAAVQPAGAAEADVHVSESGDEQPHVLMNPWRTSSERLEDALSAAAAAMPARQPGSPASVASEDAQQLTLPLSPEPLLARIRPDNEAVAAGAYGTASSAGLPPAQVQQSQPSGHQAVTALPPARSDALHQPPSSLSMLQRETLAAAAAVSEVTGQGSAREDGEDDFQPSQRSRRSAAAVRAAAAAAGAGGVEQRRRQRFVSGLRRGSAPSSRRGL